MDRDFQPINDSANSSEMAADSDASNTMNLHLRELVSIQGETILKDALARIGLDNTALMSKLPLYRSAATQLIETLTNNDMKIACFWVPGRIEICGKHTDYAGGNSLLATTNLGFCVVATSSMDESICSVITMDPSVIESDRCIQLNLNNEDNDKQEGNNKTYPVGHWSKYVRVTFERMANDFPSLRGVNIALACDLPGASGMSTSSALICALFLAIDWSSGLRQRADFMRAIPDDDALCDYLGCIENGSKFGNLSGGDQSGVGTFGGSEDHTAIMRCKSGKISMFSFCPTEFIREYEMNEDLIFVIASSGVVADKSGAKMGHYNSAVHHAKHIASQLGCANLSEVVEVYGDTVANITTHLQRSYVGDKLLVSSSLSDNDIENNTNINTISNLTFDIRRMNQFIQESNHLVPDLARALSQDSAKVEIQQLSKASHLIGAKALSNLVEATQWLPRKAVQLGALGSSAFGAGFGGSVWAVVERERAEQFMHEWEAHYIKAFPECAERACFFSMFPGPAACRL